ncbi:hypothetical protein AC579_3797 [Pseudocercospora musae]|uniref:Uncharacterized protein n=1 Tax=Pseudocercospora musae TaxID=113226 RepID=A0A139HJM9_9PEZI|nr:hypothetical protein AC579_3797 [Pseudocercospora musae]
MSPSAVNHSGLMPNGFQDSKPDGYSRVDTMNPHDKVHFDPKLQPKNYTIKGTDPDSKVLFRDVNIIDSSGREPFHGDVYVEGERIKYVGKVPDVDSLCKDPKVRTVEGRGRTLISGLGDAHTHLTWDNGELSRLGDMGVEEHTLLTAQAAKTYLDSGYTMCYGAASAKERLDVVIRDAINAGRIPGPRYLANGKEMAVPDGELAAGITAFASGPLEMREVIRHHVKLGVDNIKLSMSGEQITETRDAQDCYYTDEETAACVDEAHRHGVRLCAHARARDSVKMCIKHGVDIIYHASWIDDEGMDMLEKNKHKHIVAPGLNWLYATVYEAGAFGYSFEKAEQVGYKKELEVAIKGLKEMHHRGITVLPGGDYGFAWTPHGTYARDLELFVKYLDFTPMESIVAATAGVAKLFMRENELGKISPGYFADLILVDGDPVSDIAVLQQHDKLNVIMINGRIHKASFREFHKLDSAEPIMNPQQKSTLDHFVTYKLEDGTERSRVGHLDLEKGTITPVSYPSGTPITNLYQVIELGEEVVCGGKPFPLTDSLEVLAPLCDRDVLAVGKNYAEHAKEFNASGYDASDKADMPSHPVIFTKRATSIIANEEDILLHDGFTQSLDYEGEIGVIVGKGGSQISEQDAAEHVWGYTIINDVTAREKQRDHKQFYIGKSGDSYCPMGPMAVPRTSLPDTLTVTTHVNGELRQKGTSNDLIFSVNRLIATLSESQTLRPGDVIATGTPAGVGFGLQPSVFLKPGDLVEISVTGLGTLRNKVVKADSDTNHVMKRVQGESHSPVSNLERSNGGVGLTALPSGKKLFARTIGKGPQLVICVHGLGGTHSFYSPILQGLGLDTDDNSQYTVLLFDLEGHGLSPTSAKSKVTIESYAEDISGLIEALKLPTDRGVTILAHSMGCFIVSLYASRYPDRVRDLILIGPAPCPLPSAGADVSLQRAATVRESGMRDVALTVAKNATSSYTQSSRPLAYSTVQISLLSQDPEGYAKGCTALAGARDSEPDLYKKAGKSVKQVLIVTGDEDKISSPETAKKVAEETSAVNTVILRNVGHWHALEDLEGLTKAVREFLKL